MVEVEVLGKDDVMAAQEVSFEAEGVLMK